MITTAVSRLNILEGLNGLVFKNFGEKVKKTSFFTSPDHLASMGAMALIAEEKNQFFVFIPFFKFNCFYLQF